MAKRSPLVLLAGAALVAAIGYWGGARHGEAFVAAKQPLVAQAIAGVQGTPVRARMTNGAGSPTRHLVLENAATLDEATRARVARAVAQVPGVGGVFWADGSAAAQAEAPRYTPLHCQEDVEGLLRSRTIRFEGGSSELVPASQVLLDEVAEALQPCLGSIIAVSGHTDNSGPEPGNLELSRERAVAVREALMRRGIPRDGLRAMGYGSRQPVAGLAPSDPANRRIEFSVIATEPLVPTPVDTPGAR
jgi:OmpA-OmpF porin, OOP family